MGRPPPLPPTACEIASPGWAIGHLCKRPLVKLPSYRTHVAKRFPLPDYEAQRTQNQDQQGAVWSAGWARSRGPRLPFRRARQGRENVRRRRQWRRHLFAERDRRPTSGCDNNRCHSTHRTHFGPAKQQHRKDCASHSQIGCHQIPADYAAGTPHQLVRVRIAMTSQKEDGTSSWPGCRQTLSSELGQLYCRPQEELACQALTGRDTESEHALRRGCPIRTVGGHDACHAPPHQIAPEAHFDPALPFTRMLK